MGKQGDRVTLTWLPSLMYVRAIKAGAKRGRDGRLYFASLDVVPSEFRRFVIDLAAPQWAPVAPLPARDAATVEAAQGFRAWWEARRAEQPAHDGRRGKP